MSEVRAAAFGEDQERSTARTGAHAIRSGPRKSALRVLVTGGRDFTDTALAMEVMCRLTSEHVVTALIHGNSRGADRMTANFAVGYGIPLVPVDADWTRHGRAAGPIRNREMLALAPDVVIAFPGGDGTVDMVRQAQRAGVRVVRAIDYATDRATTLVPTLPTSPRSPA